MNNQTGYPSYPSIPPTIPLPQKTQKNGIKVFFLIFGIILGVLALLTLMLYLTIGRLYFPTTTVILYPDMPEGTTISRSELSETADILQERWLALGIPSPFTKFEVTADGNIQVKIPPTADSELIESLTARGVVELIDAGDTYLEPGSVVATDYGGNTTPGKDGNLYHTILTNEAFKTVTADLRDSGDYILRFTLENDATKFFAGYTASHIGKYLAITLDGKIIECPYIKAAIKDGKGILEGDFTQRAANSLMAILTTKPLPISLKMQP